MSKTVKTLITIAVIALLIAAALIALRFAEGIAEDTGPAWEFPEYNIIYVLGGVHSESPYVLTAEIRNEHGAFTIVNTTPELQHGHIFTIQGYEDFVLDTGRISTIAERARSMSANEVIMEEGANLADFGLDKPTATMAARYLDGTSAELHLGAAAPGGGMYAMRVGDPAIYLLFQSAADNLLHRALDLVNLVVVDTPYEMPEITKAVLGGSIRPEPIVVELLTEEQKLAMNAGGLFMGTHLITSPTTGRVHSERGNEPIMYAYAIVADRIEARLNSPGELSKWGLDEPYSTIEIESSTHESFKLMASAPDADGMLYIVREGVPLVYNVWAGEVSWLELDVFTIMDRLLILPQIDMVSRLDVRTPDHDFHVLLKGEGHDLEVELNGAPYTAGPGLESVRVFREFYADLISTQYHAFPEEPMPQNARVMLQITYSYREGREPDTVTFYEGTARRVFVQLNGETPMLALSTFVDHLYRSIDSFLAGERVVAWI